MRRAVAQLAAVALLVGTASGISSGAQETVITITTHVDAMNGDVSSAGNLLANPGRDGVSLREAIEATNNDPGTYAIRFAPALRGGTITVVNDRLPLLTGGAVSINGDIDGDGKPDVTLRKGPGGSGLTVSSGGNALRALRLEGFAVGVSFSLVRVAGGLPTGRTFAGNTLSKLVIKGGRSGSGIYFGPTGTCERRDGRARRAPLTSCAPPSAVSP